MRLKISCQATSSQLPQDYRRKILHMIKKGLEKTNLSLYQELFSDNRPKSYTFAVFIPEAKFTNNQINFNNQKDIIIQFSTSDGEIGISIYNAFMNLRQQEIPWNPEVSLIISKVELAHQGNISESQLHCRTLAPIVCRDHNRETKKDWFYNFQDSKFLDILKRNLKIKLIPVMGEYISYDIDHLEIHPIRMKKTVVKHYEKQIECSIGKFQLVGKPHLLKRLLDDGLGSMTGTGFGMIEID